MNRKILLVEPNYSNKYPPMGLMKIATYHKMIGDSVEFFKGSFSEFIKQKYYFNAIDALYTLDSEISWVDYKESIISYIVRGTLKDIDILIALNPDSKDLMTTLRSSYRNKEYITNPEYDRICITTLFTFYWDITINTINEFKQLCKNISEVKVGGIASSLVPYEFFKATKIRPHIGLLDKPGDYDENDIIIDHLPLDYSILEEIDYNYVDKNAYYSYTTRGCPNRCKFCAVPKLEPIYIHQISLSNNIEYVNQKFGPKRNLLLLDNNVFASQHFNDIIDEIKKLGFEKGAKFLSVNPYQIAYAGLLSNYNNRGYKKVILHLYERLLQRLDEKKYIDDKTILHNLLRNNNLLNYETMHKEAIISVHETILPYFLLHFKTSSSQRFVDFNQGVDARLVNESNMAKLSEIAIRPLRIAFDDWRYRPIYEKAVRLAVKYGIKNLSNYLLYNYQDEPIELFYRMKLNVELCEELDSSIYSFPMKYHPIEDPTYFKNRDYIGIHWNRKFIRAVQAVLNSTKGKIGKGTSFFYRAFGHDENEFYKIMYMPETFIIYRAYCEEKGLTEKWWKDYQTLSDEELKVANTIIEKNEFNSFDSMELSQNVKRVLSYYRINRQMIENGDY